jgi:hypothetical protein
MGGVKKTFFYWELFKQYHILPHVSEYLFSLMSFIVDCMEKFQSQN